MRWVGSGFAIATVAAVIFAVAVQMFSDDSDVGPTSSISPVTALAISDDLDSPRGSGVNLGISGIIEYVIRDGNGDVKQQVVIHNTSTAALLNAASDRLAVATTTAESSGTDIYDNLQLCSNNDNGAGSCTLVGSISDSDGGTGINPVDTVPSRNVDAGGGDTTGTYQVTDTFFCDTGGASCTAIEELQLTGGPGTQGLSEANVGAYQNVSVT